MKIFIVSLVTAYISFLCFESPFNNNWGGLEKFLGAIRSIIVSIPITFSIILLTSYFKEQIDQYHIKYLLTVIVTILASYHLSSNKITYESESIENDKIIDKYLKVHKVKLPDATTLDIDTSLVINELKSIHNYSKDNGFHQDSPIFNSYFRTNLKQTRVQNPQYILNSLQTEFVSYSSNLREFYMIISYQYPNKNITQFNGIMVICNKVNNSIQIYPNIQDTYNTKSRESVKTMLLSQLFISRSTNSISENIWNTFQFTNVRNINGETYPNYQTKVIKHKSGFEEYQLKEHLTVKKNH